jgi:DNA invertase Pin-like site-specific DNA recombinase
MAGSLSRRGHEHGNAADERLRSETELMRTVAENPFHGEGDETVFEVQTVLSDGSGLVDRPGFQRLVASVCSGSVGAVFCIEASRLARNGRDRHHLIDLCALVGALLVDTDGVYEPRLTKDRLLLGLKGTMSEYDHRTSGAARRALPERGLRVRQTDSE